MWKPITRAETQWSLKQTKKNARGGVDNIDSQAMLIMADSDAFVGTVKDMFNEIASNYAFVETWRKLILVPIPK